MSRCCSLGAVTLAIPSRCSHSLRLLFFCSSLCVSASARFKENNFKEYLFKIRAKAEMGNDQEQRVRAHVLSATPVNYVQESNYLLNEIAKYD